MTTHMCVTHMYVCNTHICDTTEWVRWHNTEAPANITYIVTGTHMTTHVCVTHMYVCDTHVYDTTESWYDGLRSASFARRTSASFSLPPSPCLLLLASFLRSASTCVRHKCMWRDWVGISMLVPTVLAPMSWLRLVGSLKLLVPFAEYRHLYRALLQKRLIILRSLLIVAIWLKFEKDSSI